MRFPFRRAGHSRARSPPESRWKTGDRPGPNRALTFGGRASIIIPPGASLLSDAIALDVPAPGDLAVSILKPGKTGPATCDFESRQTSYVPPPEDFTASAVMPAASTMVARFWLAGVEVI